MRLLLVEDDALLGDGVKAGLKLAGFSVDWVTDGHAARLALETEPYALMVLDRGLPKLSGLDLLKWLRSRENKLPVIILTARDTVSDRVGGLNAGADDYLTKPFGTAELLARIKVALRHISTAPPEAVFTLGGLEMDLSKRQVKVDGKIVKLTPTEYKLLTMMVQHAGKVVTHGQLLREVWGKRSNDQGHYLRIYMQHLRHKLGDDALNPRFLETETGIGYRLKIE